MDTSEDIESREPQKNENKNLDTALDSLGMLSSETQLHRDFKKSWVQSELRIEFMNYKPILSGHSRPRNISRMSYPFSYNDKMCMRMCPGFRSRSFPRPYRPYDFPLRRSFIHHNVIPRKDNIHTQLEKLSLQSDNIHNQLERLSLKSDERKPVLDTVVEHIPFEATSKFYVPLGSYSLSNNIDNNSCVFEPLTKDLMENLSTDFKKLCSKVPDSSELCVSTKPGSSVSL